MGKYSFSQEMQDLMKFIQSSMKLKEDKNAKTNTPLKKKNKHKTKL